MNERFFKCCKGCPNRAIGCHSSCAEYAAAHEDLERYKKIKQKDYDIERYIAIKRSFIRTLMRQRD